MKHVVGLTSGLMALQAAPLHAEPATTILRRMLGDADVHVRSVRDGVLLAPAEASQLSRDISAVLISGVGVRAVTFALILLVVACGLEWLYWTAAAAPHRAVTTAMARSPRQAFALAGRRLALGGSGLAVFGFSTIAAAVALPGPSEVASLAVTVTLLIVAIRTAWLLASVSTSPNHPSLRPNIFPPERERSVIAVVVSSAGLVAAAALAPTLVASLGSAPHLAIAIQAGLVATITFLSLAVTVIAAARLSERRPAVGRWPVPAFPLKFVVATVIVALFVIWLAGAGRIALLLIDAVVVALLIAGSRRATEAAWIDADDNDAAIEPAPEDELGLTVAVSVVRLAILLIGIAVALVIVDLPLNTLLSGGSPVGRAVLRVSGVIALLVIAQTCWIAIRTAIDRRLRQLAPLDPHAGTAEQTRLVTLLPLLRTTLLIAFVILFGLSALWTLGIEVTPLLAGAGIFGLAIGFGAQTLVRDVISGVFFLVEDVFRIGEYIESGSTTKGTVERITLRTVALRHQNGPIHFVPYGALGTVRNTSRDWVTDKFNLPLPVTVDSERIRKLVKRVGEALVADAEIGPLFREPLKAKLYRVDPGVKVFRCKFMTAPGQQFELRAAALKGIEAALQEAAIPFATNRSLRSGTRRFRRLRSASTSPYARRRTSRSRRNFRRVDASDLDVVAKKVVQPCHGVWWLRTQ